MIRYGLCAPSSGGMDILDLRTGAELVDILNFFIVLFYDIKYLIPISKNMTGTLSYCFLLFGLIYCGGITM